jgi:hypothetical protein
MSETDSTKTPKLVAYFLLAGLNEQMGSLKAPCVLRKEAGTPVDSLLRAGMVNVYLRTALKEVFTQAGKIISAATFTDAQGHLQANRSVCGYGALLSIADNLVQQNAGDFPQNLPTDLLALVDDVYADYRKGGAPIDIDPADPEQLMKAAGAFTYLQMACHRMFGYAVNIVRAESLDKAIEMLGTYGVEDASQNRAFEWARELPVVS